LLSQNFRPCLRQVILALANARLAFSIKLKWSFKVSELIFCSQTLSAETLKNQCGLDMGDLSSFGCSKPDMIIANRPYLLSGKSSPFATSTLAKLSDPFISRNLTDLSLSYGGDNLIALADISAKMQEYNIGLMGASTSVYANRIEGFVGSVKNYQGALMEYRQAVTSKSTLKTFAKQKASMAFKRMQSQFGHELKVVTNQVKSRRGTPLTRVERGLNIARSNRNIAKLDISNPVQTNNIVKFAKQAKYLGNGLAVIDFGSRVGNIHNSYKAGGNWEREMFIESSSFALSAVTGTAVVNVGGVALMFLVVATPIGWIGLIMGGVAVAGTAAIASIGVNNYIKNNSGRFYDDLIKQLGL